MKTAHQTPGLLFLLLIGIGGWVIAQTPGRTTITQISIECGFADQTHFGRICRQLTGFSPRAYKNL